MRFLVILILFSQIGFAQLQNNKDFLTDPIIRRFLALTLVIKSSNGSIMRLPFSDLPNPLQGRFDISMFSMCRTLSSKVSVRTGFPFQNRTLPIGSNTMDISIACLPMLSFFVSPNHPESLLLQNWDEDDIAIFSRWSEWKYNCFSLTKVPFGQLRDLTFKQIHDKSSFYNGEDIPSQINRKIFDEIWRHRVKRRQELEMISLGRSFVSKPFSKDEFDEAIHFQTSPVPGTCSHRFSPPGSS